MIKQKRKKEKAQESRNKGELPQPEKGHLQKSMGNVIFNDENTKKFIIRKWFWQS